jgi:AcrR family transcriptional regulator
VTTAAFDPASLQLTLRGRARQAVQSEIGRIALELMADRGFASTTADDIAVAAGVSRSSFFRYFPTKEDVVLSQMESNGELLRAGVAARPARESAWTALHRGFLDVVRANSTDPVALARYRRIADMQAETPSLRARALDQQERWRALITPAVAARFRPLPDRDPRPAALVSAALGCLSIAVEIWRTDGTFLADVLDLAMSQFDR